MASRDEYVQKMKDHLDEWNADIDRIEKRIDAAGDKVRAQWRERLAEAKEQRERLEHKIDELRQSGENTWEDVKGEAEHAWQAFRNSVNYFKSHFK